VFQLRKASSVMILALAIGAVAGSARTAAGENTKTAISTKVVTGLVTNKSGVFFITDEQSLLTYSLRGKSISKYAGKLVTIRGTLAPPASTGERVLQVLEIQPVASKVGKNSAKPAAAGVRTGLFGAPLYAATGAAVAVGTVSALYASGALSSRSDPVSRP